MRSFHPRSLFAVAALLASCAPASPPSGETPRAGNASEAITYGSADTEHEAVVALLLDEGTGYEVCSGTIVNSNSLSAYVLTAGHCVYNFAEKHYLDAAHVYIVVGDDYAAADKRKVYSASAVLPHPAYLHDTAHVDDPSDIAVVRFAPGGVVLPSIRLARSADDDGLEAGASIDLIGYGMTEASLAGKGTNTIRNQVTTKIYQLGDHLGLNAALQFTSLIDFSAHQGGTCRGDSGGPAVIRKNGELVVVGTTSYGDQSCSVAGVDVRVSGHYASFLASATGDEVAATATPGQGGSNGAAGQAGASGATCETQYPAGRAMLDQIIVACACGLGGACVANCSQDCGGISTPNDACTQCVRGATDPCNTNACWQDSECALYAKCANAASTSPPAGGAGHAAGGAGAAGAGGTPAQGGASGSSNVPVATGGNVGRGGAPPRVGGAASMMQSPHIAEGGYGGAPSAPPPLGPTENAPTAGPAARDEDNTGATPGARAPRSALGASCAVGAPSVRASASLSVLGWYAGAAALLLRRRRGAVREGGKRAI